MKREMLEGAEFFEEAKKVPASEIRRWGNDRNVFFPEDFVEFFAEFPGLCPDEWGYQFVFEDENYLEFAVISCFQYFDKTRGDYSIDDEYSNHFLAWRQPLLIPFARSDINVHAALDFRKSCRNPSVCNVDIFGSSRSEPNRPNITWLADSFTGFLDILEPYEDFKARNGEIFRF